jgi:hypothetical protein
MYCKLDVYVCLDGVYERYESVPIHEELHCYKL